MKGGCACSFCPTPSSHRLAAFANFEIYNKVLTTRLPCVAGKRKSGIHRIESSITKRNVNLNTLSL